MLKACCFRLSTSINKEISEIRKIDQGKGQRSFKNTWLHDKVRDFDNCRFKIIIVKCLLILVV